MEHSAIQTSTQRRQKLAKALTVVACTCLMLITGCSDQSDKVTVKPPAPDVRVANVVRQNVPIIKKFSGTVKSIKSVDIIPRVSGYIDERYFEEGTFVEKDDPLYLIDPRPFQAQLDADEAQLKQHEASAAFWQSEEKRYTSLAKQGAGSVEDKEKAVARHLEMLAKIQGDKANIDKAKLDLGFTKITAPFSGRVQDTRINVGQLVHEQQDVLTTLKQIDPIYVVFHVSRSQIYETQLLKREGLAYESWRDFKVQVRLSDGSVYENAGKLDYISAQIDPDTDTLEYRAIFPNPVDRTALLALIPGQYVPVMVTVGEDPNTLLIPGPSLVESQVGTEVYVVNQDNKVESRKVDVGQAYKQQWIIKKGLKEGERVIYDGVQKVRPGMVVSIKDNNSTPAK